MLSTTASSAEDREAAPELPQYSPISSYEGEELEEGEGPEEEVLDEEELECLEIKEKE